MNRIELAATALLVLAALALAAGRGSRGEPQEPAPPPEETSHHQGHHGDHEARHSGGHPEGEHHRHGEDGVHHDFSDAERWAAIFEGDERDTWQKPAEVARLMSLAPGMTVADLGAGSGYFLPYLSKAVGPEGKVLGLDPEANFISFMTRRAEEHGWSNVEARQIPLDNPGLEEASVDRVLVVNTWHHIDNRSTYASKLARVLKEDGALYVVDFTKDSPYGPSVESRLPPEKVLGELQAGGLHAELVEAGLPWQYVIVARNP